MWRDWDLGFGTRRIFEDIDREFRDAEEMLNRMFRTVREMRPPLTSRAPFRITMATR
jgi:hypothetical protein